MGGPRKNLHLNHSTRVEKSIPCNRSEEVKEVLTCGVRNVKVGKSGELPLGGANTSARRDWKQRAAFTEIE